MTRSSDLDLEKSRISDQIINGDSNNLQNLSELLTQAEELLKESHEESDNEFP